MGRRAPVPSLFVLEFAQRSLRLHEDIRSGREVNRVVGELVCQRLPSVDFAHGDLTSGKQCPEHLAAVSADGSTVWVLIRRLNSSWSRSIALVVRALFHWLSGSRVNVKRRSPASARLSATALHLSRHLRLKARRRCSISAAEAA